MEYRREIDGLRALAVVPVLLFHAGFDAFGGGFVGVDIFFVISGYLITSIILAERQEGIYTIAHFYERRARRILPALFLVMFACLPMAWLWLFPRPFSDFSLSLIAVPLFASNILFWQTSGYFSAAVELKPLLHTWSLAVEEQYYVLFPLFLTLTWRLGRRWVVFILVAIALASLAAAEWGSVHKHIATFYLLPTRAWELIIGVLIAFYFSSCGTPRHHRGLAEISACLGLLMIGYAIVRFNKFTPFPSLYALIPTIGTGLIILFATSQTLVGRLLGHKLFVGIGLISFSAYLWHQPLLAFARNRSPTEPAAATMASLVLATFLLAYLSWRFVEQPFRNKRRFTRRQIFSYGLAGSMFFIGIGVIGVTFKGFPDRLPQSVQIAGDEFPSIDNGWCFYDIDERGGPAQLDSFSVFLSGFSAG